MPLKCVRRTARLEGAAAKNARTGAAHMVGCCHQLELGLNRARPRHGDEFVTADLKIEHLHDCLLAPRALQHVGGFGKSFVPASRTLCAPFLGKRKHQSTAIVTRPPPPKD